MQLGRDWGPCGLLEGSWKLQAERLGFWILALPLAGYVTVGTLLRELDRTNPIWWLRLNEEFHKSLKCDQLLLDTASHFLCRSPLSFVQAYPQSLGGRASFKLWLSCLMSKGAENPCMVFEARQHKFKPQQHNTMGPGKLLNLFKCQFPHQGKCND